MPSAAGRCPWGLLAAVAVGKKGDPLAVGGEVGYEFVGGVVGQVQNLAAAQAHGVDFVVAAAVALKQNPLAVGAEDGSGVPAGDGSESPLAAAVQVHQVEP